MTKYSGTLIALVVMTVCVTVLIALGKDPGSLITFSGPAILLLINQIKTDAVHDEVQEVARQVNGRMTDLISKKTQPDDTIDPDPREIL